MKLICGYDEKNTKYDISSTIKKLNLNLNYHYSTKCNHTDHVIIIIIIIEDTLEDEIIIEYIECSWYPVKIAVYMIRMHYS